MRAFINGDVIANTAMMRKQRSSLPILLFQVGVSLGPIDSSKYNCGSSNDIQVLYDARETLIGRGYAPAAILVCTNADSSAQYTKVTDSISSPLEVMDPLGSMIDELNHSTHNHAPNVRALQALESLRRRFLAREAASLDSPKDYLRVARSGGMYDGE